MTKLFSALVVLLLSAALAGAQDPTTPNLGLTLPTIGSSSWGEKVNENFELIDALFPGTGTVNLTQDEGIALPLQTNLNFIGAGVTCANDDANDRINCTIPGGGGGAVADGTFIIQNTTDITKQAVFDLSNITAGQTRVIIVPDASLTLVGTTLAQTLTNKTLGNTTVLTIKDGSLTLQSTADATKQATFDLSNITAGQTRSIVVPDGASATVVGGAAVSNQFVTTISALGAITRAQPTVSNLSASTSADLAAVISNETGSNFLVFNTNATLVTPFIASFVNATHDHSAAAGGGQLSATAVLTASKAGNGTKFQMFTGAAPATDDCAKFDVDGNIVGAGSACGSGGGGSGDITAVNVTSPITGGGSSGDVTIACATCAVTGTGLSQFASTTSAQLATLLSDEEGSAGGFVRGTGATLTSVILVTPTLGVADATTINKVTITAPATNATLTLSQGSSLITSGGHSITLTSTGATNVTLPTTGTLATVAATQPIDATLTALAAYSTNGFLVQTAADTFAGRTFQNQTGILTWTNADGVSGNPSLALATAVRDLSGRGCSDAGGDDTYTCDMGVPDLAYITNALYILKPATANTGAASINYSSIGVVDIKKFVSGSKVDPATGDICANHPSLFLYDGTHMVLVSTLCNPASGSISATTGTILKAGSTTTGVDSSIVEDADSINLGKTLEACAGATCLFNLDTSIFATTLKTWGFPVNASDTFVGIAAVQTLSNKTMSGASNTFSNLATTSLVNAARDDTKNVTILAPTTGETNKVQFAFAQAVTLQEIGCSTDTGTVSIQFDKRTETTPNTSGTNALTSTLVCDSDRQESTTFTSATVTTSQILNLQITAVASAPNVVRIHVIARKD